MTRFPTAPGRTYVNRAGEAVLEHGMAVDGSKTFHLTDRTTGATVSLSQEHLAFLVREAKIPMSVDQDVLELAASEAFTASNLVMGRDGDPRDFRTQIVEWTAIARAAIAAALPAVSSPLPIGDRALARLDSLLGIDIGSDAALRYNAATDAAVNALLLANSLRRIAESGKGGTTGEGHADCIEQAKRMLDIFDDTALGLTAKRADEAAASVARSLDVLSKPAVPAERPVFEVVGGAVTPELRREMLRDVAEFIAGADGGMIEIEDANGKRSFDIALVMHSHEQCDLSNAMSYDTQFLTGEDATNVDSMPEAVFASGNPIIFERQDGQEVEGQLMLDTIEKVEWSTFSTGAVDKSAITIHVRGGGTLAMRIV